MDQKELFNTEYVPAKEGSGELFVQQEFVDV